MGAGIYTLTSPNGLAPFIPDLPDPTFPQPVIPNAASSPTPKGTLDPHPIALASGHYLMAYKTEPTWSTSPADHEIHVAKSLDGKIWAPGPMITHGSVPGLVQAPDGTLFIYYVDVKLGRVTIDAGQPRAPISPNVFSQFIEYQGRAIYGGIWAEMLADRKFFLNPPFHVLIGNPQDIGPSAEAINSRVSPWFVSLGTQVQKTAPYAGRLAPAITLDGAPHRLIQGDLGIVAGKAYRAHIVMAGAGSNLSVEIRLRWVGGQASCPLPAPPSNFVSQDCMLTAGATTDRAWLEIEANGMGGLGVGAVSLMPGDNINGLRADVLALMGDLQASVYRWPGGADLDSYRYDHALGPRDERPPEPIPRVLELRHRLARLRPRRIHVHVLDVEREGIRRSGHAERESNAVPRRRGRDQP